MILFAELLSVSNTLCPTSSPTSYIVFFTSRRIIIPSILRVEYSNIRFSCTLSITYIPCIITICIYTLHFRWWYRCWLCAYTTQFQFHEYNFSCRTSTSISIRLRNSKWNTRLSYQHNPALSSHSAFASHCSESTMIDMIPNQTIWSCSMFFCLFPTRIAWSCFYPSKRQQIACSSLSSSSDWDTMLTAIKHTLCLRNFLRSTSPSSRIQITIILLSPSIWQWQWHIRIRSSHRVKPCPTDANGEVVTSTKKNLLVWWENSHTECEWRHQYLWADRWSLAPKEKNTGEMGIEIRNVDACHSLHKIFSWNEFSHSDQEDQLLVELKFCPCFSLHPCIWHRLLNEDVIIHESAYLVLTTIHDFWWQKCHSRNSSRWSYVATFLPTVHDQLCHVHRSRWCKHSWYHPVPSFDSFPNSMLFDTSIAWYPLHSRPTNLSW